MDIKLGDVVELNSGGPYMTVTYIEAIQSSTVLHCSWFLDGKVLSDRFEKEAVKKVD